MISGQDNKMSLFVLTCESGCYIDANRQENPSVFDLDIRWYKPQDKSWSQASNRLDLCLLEKWDEDVCERKAQSKLRNAQTQ